MKRIKEIIALSLGACALVGLASCSDDVSTSSSNVNNETTEEVPSGIVTGKETNTGSSTFDTTTIDSHQHIYTHVDSLAPLCGVEGNKEYYYCESCGEYFDKNKNEVTLEELTIPALEHTFDDVTYTWSSDNSTCTAKRVCEKCNYTEIETVDVNISIEKSTCNKKGIKIYTADFSKTAFETQTKELEISTIDHIEGTQVKENIVESTFDSEGSYDLVTYCTECGSELSREKVITSKLIPKQISDYHDEFISIVYDGMVFKKSNGEDFFSLHNYFGQKDSIVIPNVILYEGVQFPVERITSIGTSNKVKNIDVPSSVKRIEEFAFKNVETLESITLNEGLEFIGTYAFENTSLKSIVIPKTVKEIKPLAFKNLKTLESVTLNEGLEFLGQSAFKNTAIKKIVLPSSIKTIEEAVFSGCLNLKEVVFNDGITYISNQMFYDCTSLNKVTLPKGLTTISSLAFAYCGIEEIELPEGIISYYNAFSGCKNLKKIILPNGIKSISSSAFSNCTSLEEVVFPEGLETIGESAFLGCERLKNVSLPLGLKTISSYAFYKCKSLDTIDLPATLEKIDSHAFEYTNLFIFIPDTVKTISVYAFYNIRLIYTNALKKNAGWTSSFTNLKSVAYGVEKDECVLIDDMVFMIDKEEGNASFFDCFNEYESITIPSKVSFDNTEYSVTKIYKKYFYENKTIKEVLLPDTVVSFDDYTFYRCDKLETILLPASVRDLGRGFLSASDNIKSIDIPEGVTIIQDYCFNSCDSLEKVTLPSTLLEIESYSFYNSNLKSIIIPNSVNFIDKTAFQYCYKLVEVYNLSNVKLDTSYKLMENNIIYNTSLDVESKINYDSNGFLYVYNDNVCHLVDYIGKEEKIVLPDSISLDSKVFNEYDIHKYAFSKNKYLKSITIPGFVKNIGDYAFFYCDSLVEVNIKDGVESLKEGAFYYCTSIKEIILPNSIIEMGNGAFCDCSSLESITLSDNIPVIGLNAFYACESLKNINFPNALKEIGKNAFLECYSLSKVELPNQLTSIGEAAFSWCGSITSIVIPSSVKNIGPRAFWHTEELEELIISEGVERIDNGAFSYCRRLMSVTIPSTVIYMGDSIFEKCYRLVEIYNLGVDNQTLLGGNVIKVHTSKDEASAIVIDEDGFIFGYDGNNGYLYGYIGKEIFITLPEFFIYNGEKISSYGIVANAFTRPSTTKYLRTGIYSGKNSLVSIVIPSNVTSIAVDAFADSESLAEIYNLSSCEIEYSGFIVASIYIHKSLDEKSNIVVDSNGFVFWVIDSYCRLIKYIGNDHDLILPNRVIYNGKQYFEYTISDYAFAGRDDITSIRISSSVKSLSDFVFGYCSNLEYVILPKKIGFESRLAYCKYHTTKIYYLGTSDEFISNMKTSSADYIPTDVYYFTYNKDEESRTGKWWYYDTDSFTIIEKVI